MRMNGIPISAQIQQTVEDISGCLLNIPTDMIEKGLTIGITREMEIGALEETKFDIMTLLVDAPDEDTRKHYHGKLEEINQQIKELNWNG